nr:MAG TPA: hypothetical protein [Caudoviricetes sp.]
MTKKKESTAIAAVKKSTPGMHITRSTTKGCVRSV